MRYRKKPVSVNAWDISDLLLFSQHGTGLPEQVELAIAEGLIDVCDDHINILTLEGLVVGRHGDMLIEGVEGEFYPCRRDIFEKTYEREK